MKEQNKLLAWVKVHKKELIITGVSSTAIIAIIFCYRNKKYLTTLWTTLQATIAKILESEPVVAEAIIEAPETIVDVIEPMKLMVVDSSNIDQISFLWNARKKILVTNVLIIAIHRVLDFVISR